MNIITAVLDKCFLEFTEVFKHPFKGKASIHLLKVCPIPRYILELEEEGVLAETRKAEKRPLEERKPYN